MKTCDQIQDVLLTDYVDGRLSVDQKALIDRHLLTCATCQEFWVAARQVEDLVRMPVKEGPSVQVWENVRERIEAQPVRWLEGLWGTFLRPAGALVLAVAVVAIIIGGLFPRSGDSSFAKVEAKESVLLSYFVEEDAGSMADDKTYQTAMERFLDETETFAG